MRILVVFAFTSLLLTQMSCDRVEIAYRDIPDLDSSFYPGLWADYLINEWPIFEQNTNTQRNVLIEKFTGHKCTPCVTAALTIKTVVENYPNRAFYASLHAGPGGMTGFQSFNASAYSFNTDHTNPITLSYGVYFQTGYGFIGNPGITVNKELFGGGNSNMFAPASETESRVQQIIQENDLRYNIQSTFRYFPQTKGGYLHVEVEKLQEADPPVDLIVYVIQDSLRDWQKLPVSLGGGDDPNYKHTNKHLGNIDNLVWGQRLNFSEGNKVYKDYSFGKPAGIEAENIHFLIFVSDAETKRVYQVIKQKMVE
jgi:hypothetical protein